MKPGNLRKQGANSGGGNRQMRKLLPARFVCDEAIFLWKNTIRKDFEI